MSDNQHRNIEKNSASAKVFPFVEGTFKCSVCNTQFTLTAGIALKRAIVAEELQLPIFCAQKCEKKYKRQQAVKSKKEYPEAGGLFPDYVIYYRQEPTDKDYRGIIMLRHKETGKIKGMPLARYIMQEYLGRILNRNERVRHIGDIRNNDPTNLYVQVNKNKKEE